MKTLLLVDIQNDFITGSLPVPNAAEILPVIEAIMPTYDRVITTHDCHPENHCSFKENGGLWPVHCVKNSMGYFMPHDLMDSILRLRLGVYGGDFRKGENENVDSYSAFYDNERRSSTGLTNYLNLREIKEIDVVGIATEYCIMFTVLDAIKDGFKVNVLTKACRGVNINPNDVTNAIVKMRDAGANII